MFRPKILNIRHLRRFFILALMASNDEFFGAHRVTNFESEYDILVLTSDFLHMCVCLPRAAVAKIPIQTVSFISAEKSKYNQAINKVK